MDLIVTDAGHIDRAVIEDYALDAAWGADENDFELTVDRMLEPGSYVYADGSEIGGVIDSLRDRLERGGSTLTYGGRTWHGILANKILAPDTGQNYLTVSGKASTVIGMIVNRVGLAPPCSRLSRRQRASATPISRPIKSPATPTVMRD